MDRPSVIRIQAKFQGSPESFPLFISTSRFIRVPADAVTRGIDLGSDVHGILNVALEIAARRRECIGRLRQAVEANNVREIVRIAKELCGCGQEGNRTD